MIVSKRQIKILAMFCIGLANAGILSLLLLILQPSVLMGTGIWLTMAVLASVASEWIIRVIGENNA